MALCGDPCGPRAEELLLTLVDCVVPRVLLERTELDELLVELPPERVDCGVEYDFVLDDEPEVLVEEERVEFAGLALVLVDEDDEYDLLDEPELVRVDEERTEFDGALVLVDDERVELVVPALVRVEDVDFTEPEDACVLVDSPLVEFTGPPEERTCDLFPVEAVDDDVRYAPCERVETVERAG